MAGSAEDRAYRRIVSSWAMYDWANSAFYTIIVSAVFPPFYRSLVKAAGVAEGEATSYWAFTASAGLFTAALLGPVLGAIADQVGGKKSFIGFFTALGVVASALMFFLQGSAYLWASALFIIGTIGVAGGNIFYESLLPHVARRGDIDQISTRGYALGYVGGGLLLSLCVCWILYPRAFFLADSETAVRVSFLSVAVWWALFSIPLFRNVPEPPAVPVVGPGQGAVLGGFARLVRTFRQIRQYRQLLLFLIAFWLYNDGIGTIIKMATAYGDEIGIGVTDMILALIMTQFIGVPSSFAFGFLAGKIGARSAVLLGLIVYALISLFAFFMVNATHFFILAAAVGLVQGGTQALSRSLYGSMIPCSQAAEFFGFYGTSSKFAGIAGPLLFGLISQLTGHSRLSILSLLVFFVVGGVLLAMVDVEEGKRIAAAEDRAARDV